MKKILQKVNIFNQLNIQYFLGMENPDPSPRVELVEIPNIPLASQPSANIPPSTNRNLRNVTLFDLDCQDYGTITKTF